MPLARLVDERALVNAVGGLLATGGAGTLARDFVAVVRFQGPRANGMPELHQLTPALTSLQSQGPTVALVTDGRMSGASGAIPVAIHVTPECLHGSPLARVRDGDVMRLDSYAGVLEARVPDEVWGRREIPRPDLGAHARGTGRRRSRAASVSSAMIWILRAGVRAALDGEGQARVEGPPADGVVEAALAASHRARSTT